MPDEIIKWTWNGRASKGRSPLPILFSESLPLGPLTPMKVSSTVLVQRLWPLSRTYDTNEDPIAQACTWVILPS